MTSTSLIQADVTKESRIAEYKSSNGIVFRAKLIGNVDVDELRGKTIAENAMAKLKFDIFKKRQHKTKVNVHLKWDGFYVYLSEGGQEMLHHFQLEQISFVWKDPSDDRAIGIIATDNTGDKQTVSGRFYAYKTEKPAIPLIMALKELFIFKTNKESETVNDDHQLKPESTAESEKSAQDLLDFDFSSEKPQSIEDFIKDNSTKPNVSNWNTFSQSQANAFTTIPTVTQMPTMMANHLPWMPYMKGPDMFSNQFNISWPVNSSNPFVPPMPAPINVYPYPPNPSTNIVNPKKVTHQTMDLFSDLIPTDYGLNSPIKSFSNNKTDDTKRISLVDMKNSLKEKDSQMDFSFLDKPNNGPVMKDNNSTSNQSDSIVFLID